jgi:hypothetical protein
MTVHFDYGKVMVYSTLKKFDLVKGTAICVRILLTISGVLLSFAVIWYERFSADIRYRY